MPEPASDRPSPQSVVPAAVVVEGGMGLLAVLLGWLLGYLPGDAMTWDWTGLAWGMAAAVPLVAVMAVCIWVPWKPLRELVRVVDETVVPLFRQCRLIDLALIAALAGLGEEMLFRGVLQRAIAGRSPGELRSWGALVASGLLFGIAHSITWAYAALAALIGCYLGWLWLATGNLLVPIVAHAVYDFVALVYLSKLRVSKTVPGE